MVSKSLLFVLSLVVWVFSLSGVGEATMTLPVSLEQMTARAGKIFVGRCVSVSYGEDEHGFPATFAEFEVLHAIKGVDTDYVNVKHFGTRQAQPTDSLLPELLSGESGIVQTIRTARSPYRYRPDEEIILFLYPDSELGFTSPIGFGQGLFRIEGTEDGVPTVRNHFNNLFLGLHYSGGNAPLTSPPHPLSSLARSESDARSPRLPWGGSLRLSTDHGINYQSFIDVVEGMVEP